MRPPLFGTDYRGPVNQALAGFRHQCTAHRTAGTRQLKTITDLAVHGLRQVQRTIVDGTIQPDKSSQRRSIYRTADCKVWFIPRFGFEGAPISELGHQRVLSGRP